LLCVVPNFSIGAAPKLLVGAAKAVPNFSIGAAPKLLVGAALRGCGAVASLAAVATSTA
jgi:hypothetical protein